MLIGAVLFQLWWRDIFGLDTASEWLAKEYWERENKWWSTKEPSAWIYLQGIYSPVYVYVYHRKEQMKYLITRLLKNNTIITMKMINKMVQEII